MMTPTTAALTLRSMNRHIESGNTMGLERVVKRPILRYHGGKWMLAEWIISRFPKHRVYVEPFGGAASVLLQKSRSYGEVYNDLSGEICNVFRVVRDFPTTLARELIWTPFSRDEYRAAFERCDD